MKPCIIDGKRLLLTVEKIPNNIHINPQVKLIFIKLTPKPGASIKTWRISLIDHKFSFSTYAKNCIICMLDMVDTKIQGPHFKPWKEPKIHSSRKQTILAFCHKQKKKRS